MMNKVIPFIVYFHQSWALRWSNLAVSQTLPHLMTPDQLLKQAESLGKDANYHAWVDAALSSADLIQNGKLLNKEKWYGASAPGNYYSGCPGFPRNRGERNFYDSISFRSDGSWRKIDESTQLLAEEQEEEADPTPWVAAAKEMKIPIEFLKRCHHTFYGLKWVDRQEEWMNTAMMTNIQPNQTFFDVGCGSMRLGIPMTEYLKEGNYYGLDAETISLRAAIQYEVPIAGLIKKKPRLLKTFEFKMSKIAPEKSIDVIAAFVVLKKTKYFEPFFSEAAKVLKQDGQIVIALDGGKEEPNIPQHMHSFASKHGFIRKFKKNGWDSKGKTGEDIYFFVRS